MTFIRGLRIIETDAGVVAADEHHVTGVASGDFVSSLAAGGGSGAGSVDTDEPTQGSDAWLFAKVDSQGAWTRQLAIYSPAPPPPNPVAPTFTVDPVVTGTGIVSGVLTCSAGTVTGTPTPTRTYQWRKAAVSIGGETTNSYTPVSGDIGAAIDCLVTATNATGSDSADSNDVTITAANDPAAIFGTDIVGWWRASDTSGADGASVSSAPAASGSPGSFVQATSGKRPVLKLSILNGKSVWRFDGTDDVLAWTNGGTPPAPPYVIGIVYKVRASPSGDPAKFVFGTVSGAKLKLSAPDGSGFPDIDWDNGQHVISGHYPTPTTFAAWLFTATGTAGEIRVNDVVPSGGSGAQATSKTVDVINLGVDGLDASNYADADVADIFVAKRAPTSGDRSNLAAYYLSEYGLS